MTDEFFSRLPKPKIPTLENVQMNTMRLGGTPEMAQAFYNKWDAVGWYKVNPTQPIINYIPLLSMFIQNWKTNDQQRSKGNQNWGGF
jgi:hypothetical protein